MVEARVILSALWVALMPTYLLGDVLRTVEHDDTAMSEYGPDDG